MKSSFTILSRSKYFLQLAHDINATQAGDTVRLMTMAFRPEIPEIQPTIAALNHAPSRGLDVHRSTDAMPFLLGNSLAKGPLLFSRSISKHLRHPFGLRRDTLETLQTHGGQ